MSDTIIIDDTTPETIVVSAGDTTNVEVNEVGLQGAAGGDAAPPYVHTQSVPAATWSITHNLGYRPSSVRVEDSAEDEIDGFDIVNETNNSLDLVFGGAFSGVARIK